MSKITFITNYESAKEYYPPLPIKKLIPGWYKSLGRYPLDRELSLDPSFLILNNFQTIPQTGKSCIPMRDYLMSGYVVRAQSDVLIKQEEDDIETGVTNWSWFSSDPKILNLGTHNFNQLPVPLNDKKNSYLKFNVPWAIKTPKGYSCLLYQPELFFENRFKLLPAIIDTDLYNEPISFPGFITAAKKSFKLEAGTPLMAVFPFRREKWEMDVSFTQKEFTHPFMFLNWYKKLFHTRKSYD